VFQEGDRRNQLLHMLKGNTPPPDWPHVNEQPADVQIHQVVTCDAPVVGMSECSTA
jgi:hypothetical protein